MSSKPIKRQRFEKVAAKRVQKILDLLDILGNCANRNNYEYTEDDVRKMFIALESRLKHTKALFGNQLINTEKNNFKF